MGFGGVSPHAVAETLKTVRRVTKRGIVINTFMLDDSPELVGFVERMTEINKGRAFFTSPGRLGAFLMVDYLAAARMAPLMARAAGIAGRIWVFNAVRIVRRGVGHFGAAAGTDLDPRVRPAPPIEDLLPPALFRYSRSLALLPGAAPGVGARRFGPASGGCADSSRRGATRVRPGPDPAPRHRAGARCGQAGGGLRRDPEQRGHAAGECRQPALAARERLRLPARAALRELFREGPARQPGRGARGGAMGGFKSAAEIFTREAMSPEHREQLEEVIDDFFATLVGGIAEGRGIDADRVRALIDGAPYGARAAVEAGLVDACLYPDQIEDALEELTSAEAGGAAGGCAGLLELPRLGSGVSTAPG